MPKNKTDEQMRREYIPKIKAFTDERLTSENAKRIYNFLKPYNYDTSGWLLYEAAKGILQADVYSEFPAEDNMGYFESLDGFGLLKWLEIAKFADKEYEQIRGGYGLLKSHTLYENTPKYTEYQNKLWPAAIRSITISLTDKQPYLLEGFWNRLSYIENIIEKGFPTLDDLYNKINSESKNLAQNANKENVEGELSEYEAKWSIYNALYDVHMTDEMIQALFVTDDVLGDMYKFFIAENKDNQIYLSVYEYLEKAEHDYLADMVYDRVKLEYEDYVDEVKKMPPDKIIDEAYKLTMLYDIYSSFDPYCSEYSTERLKALHSISNPLWCLYQEWQHRDYSHMDDIKDVIEYIADKQTTENEEKWFEIDPDPFGMDEEAEDGQEP